MSKKIAKRIIIDALGYLLVVVGIILMPVPGPGGLPITLAGLGLLSIENDWARSARKWLIDNGHGMAARFFPDKKEIQALYDLLVVVMLSLAIFTLTKENGRLVELAAGLGISGSLLVFLFNRQRLDKILAKFKK